jgi:hypothetical protein
MDTNALHQSIIHLYEELSEWRRVLPYNLKTLAEEDHHPLAISGVRNLSQAHVLQQTVLLFLEHNCYMQIEAWASDSGIATPSSLDAVMLHHLIEYKTLKSAKSTAEVAPLLHSEKICRNAPTGVTAYPLVDVAPSILRDICAGTSYWLSNRAKKLLDQEMWGGSSARSETQDFSDYARKSGAQRVKGFTAGAAALKDAVAAATSHRETSPLVEELNEHFLCLERMIARADSG